PRDVAEIIAKNVWKYVDGPAPQDSVRVGDGVVVLDRGFKYENGIHTPTVLVGFAPSDFAARDKFAEALTTPAPAAGADGLAEIGELIRTQDNRITSEPVFVVEQRTRIYGLDTDYTESVA